MLNIRLIGSTRCLKSTSWITLVHFWTHTSLFHAILCNSCSESACSPAREEQTTSDRWEMKGEGLGDPFPRGKVSVSCISRENNSIRRLACERTATMVVDLLFHPVPWPDCSLNPENTVLTGKAMNLMELLTKSKQVVQNYDFSWASTTSGCCILSKILIMFYCFYICFTLLF